MIYLLKTILDVSIESDVLRLEEKYPQQWRAETIPGGPAGPVQSGQYHGSSFPAKFEAAMHRQRQLLKNYRRDDV